ncbi:MAG TPA: hypothetical protein VHF26_26445 [Trebonia sp.]|nr:hypothetical protein [Trebonia sp.]
MAMRPATPPPGAGAWGSTDESVLRAWLYEVRPDGTSHPMAPPGRPMAWVEPSGTLYVSVEGGQNTPTRKYLKAPPAEGMSTDPVTVSMDQRTGVWMIWNSGHTNTLRVQQYGLSAVPLRPQTMMPMAGRDVAVWIPVVPRGLGSGKSESFRLLILAGQEKQLAGPGPTRLITAPRRYLSAAKQEALIAYFGDHLSWPPLPAPHVRQQAEVEKIAYQHRLPKEPTPERWARNRFDVLAGRDGLFRDADWFPRLGGPDRTLANHLAAFHRLVELRTITLRRVCDWVREHDVAPYALIDPQLIPPR